MADTCVAGSSSSENSAKADASITAVADPKSSSGLLPDPPAASSAQCAHDTGNGKVEQLEHHRDGAAGGIESTDLNMQATARAILEMEAPAGWRRYAVPKKTVNRSILYDKGVRYEQDAITPDPKKHRWYCMASASCREESMKTPPGGGINIEQTATGNATRHLNNTHGLVSGKTMASIAIKATRDAEVISSPKAAQGGGPDTARRMGLMYVRAFIIAHLLSIHLSDSADVRRFFEVCGANSFPHNQLYPKMIKHYVAELYAATVSNISRIVQKALGGAGGPVLHANFDLWTSKVSSRERYIGLRLFWMSADFSLDSTIVAAKLFRPATALGDGSRLSDTLRVWAEEVLAEFGVLTSDLFSTVTDAGSEAKRLSLKVASAQWEWSFPHMLNCALVEAFGTGSSRSNCSNPGARETLDAVTHVVECLNKSPAVKVILQDLQGMRYGKATKLVDAVPDHWMSLCNVLEQVLRSWPVLEKDYATKETTKEFPLSGYKATIEELHSLLEPVAGLITRESRQTAAPTGLSFFLALVALRCTVLKEGKPLTVQSYRHTTQPVANESETAAEETPRAIERAATDLEGVTVRTRKALAAAVDKRFFDERYNERVESSRRAPPGPGPDYLFEMAACMNPFCSRLQWLSVLCSSDAEARRVRLIIRRNVVRLMTRMAEGAGGAVRAMKGGKGGNSGKRVSAGGSGGGGSGSGSGSGSGKGPAAWKRRKKIGEFVASSVSDKKVNQEVERLMASGMFGESSAGAGKHEEAPETARQTCQAEFDAFLEHYEDVTGLMDYPVESMPLFWESQGKALFPNMARAARVLLSVPASSAVRVRDFSTDGRLVARCRGSKMDAAYAEMVLCLNASQAYIPNEVPALSAEQAERSVPRRLSNPREEVRDLSVGEEEDEVVDEDEYEKEREMFEDGMGVR